MSQTDERPATQEGPGFDGDEVIIMPDVSTKTLPKDTSAKLQAKVKRKAKVLKKQLDEAEADPDLFPQHKKLQIAYKQ
jgi:hypothetical protein